MGFAPEKPDEKDGQDVRVNLKPYRRRWVKALAGRPPAARWRRAEALPATRPGSMGVRALPRWAGSQVDGVVNEPGGPFHRGMDNALPDKYASVAVMGNLVVLARDLLARQSAMVARTIGHSRLRHLITNT